MTTNGRQDGRVAGGRLVALAGAVALVLVAIVVRNALGGGEDGGGSGSDATLTLLCPSSLVSACEEATGDGVVVVEQPPSETTGTLVGDSGSSVGEADLWLAPRPWAEAVSELTEPGALEHLTGYLDSHQEALARSPIVVMAWEERAQALEAGPCGGELTWLCLGDVADRDWGDVGGDATWGRVRAGLADAASTEGLVVLGTAAAAYLDDASYHTNDIDPELVRWLDGFVVEDATGADPVRDMLTRGPGHLAVLGTVEAAARTAAGRDDVRVEVLDPRSTVDLVMVPLTDEATDEAERWAEDNGLLDALAAAGWRVPGRDLASGLDSELDLPDEAGVPTGVVLHALLTRSGQ